VNTLKIKSLAVWGNLWSRIDWTHD